MKKLALFLILSAAAFAQTLPQFTWGNNYSGTSGTIQFNAAGTWAAVWHSQDKSLTNTTFSFQVTAVAGTVDPAGVQVDLVSAPLPAVTYNDSTDVVIPTGGNYYTAGNQVTLLFGTGPAGVTYNALYYVCNPNATDFQIDNDADCMSPVTDFSGSSGSQRIARVLERSTTIDSTPTGAGWRTMTFNTAITYGTQYGFKISNVTGTPASNNFTIATGPSVTGGLSANPRVSTALGTDGVTNGVIMACSSGATCGSAPRTAFYRVGFSDSSYAGQPFTASVSGSGIASGDRIQGTVEIGARFVVPTGISAKVRCIFIPVNRVNSATANLQMRLYTGADSSESLVATSNARSFPEVTTGVTSWPFCFSSAVDLPSGTVVRAMLSPASSGDTSTNYYSTTVMTIQNSAESKALVLGGAMKAKFDGSSTWTYTDTEFVPFQLILDVTTPFNTQSSGGGSFVYAN